MAAERDLFAVVETATAADDHWRFFDWPSIIKEAEVRLEQARGMGKDAGEHGTLEYWTAWAAHANLAACFAAQKNPGHEARGS